MINNRLRNLIYPYLKMEINQEEWKYMEYMLDNAYRIKEDGLELITIPPSPISDQKYGYQFDSISGAFITICLWNDVKQRGTKI